MLSAECSASADDWSSRLPGRRRSLEASQNTLGGKAVPTLEQSDNSRPPTHSSTPSSQEGETTSSQRVKSSHKVSSTTRGVTASSRRHSDLLIPRRAFSRLVPQRRHNRFSSIYDPFSRPRRHRPKPLQDFALLSPRSREERDGDEEPKEKEGNEEARSQVEDLAIRGITSDESPRPTKTSITPSGNSGASAVGSWEMESNGRELEGVTRAKLILDKEDMTDEYETLCRSREKFLPPKLYEADACALCYQYMPNPDFFVVKWKLQEVTMKVKEGDSTSYIVAALLDPVNGSYTLEANTSSEILLSTFSSEAARDRWRTCCAAAVDCCNQIPDEPWPDGFCPHTWDGWQCWPPTLAATEAKRPCPPYSYLGKPSSCPKLATKQCTAGGRWFSRVGEGGQRQEWSNYSSCSVAEGIIRRLYVHVGAYAVSVVALLPALLIFFSYKQLRVHRITLHKHLFISLLLEASGVITLRLLQLNNDTAIKQNQSWCIALNLVTKYGRVSNYMWYLCEGYYLHKLLASAFAEQSSLVTFYLIGWGFPLLPLVVYAGIRGVGDRNANCWIVPIEGLEWVINLPPLLAILINIIFVVNIIRILVSIVRAPNYNEPLQYRKTVRATMMVVPLFGLQYIVTIYRPMEIGCEWHEVYQIINNVIEGGTGAVVAVIYCYTNSEVRALVKRSWVRLRERRAPRGTTRGSMAQRSRSLSTVQTTLIDPSPARRNSSIISLCAGAAVRRSNSSATQLVSLRGSRTNLSQLQQASTDVMGVPGPGTAVRRSPKQNAGKIFRGSPEKLSSKCSIHEIHSLSRSPSLLEEPEDETSNGNGAVISVDLATQSPKKTTETLEAKDGKHPVVVFRKDDEEATVNISVNGQLHFRPSRSYENAQDVVCDT